MYEMIQDRSVFKIYSKKKRRAPSKGKTPIGLTMMPKQSESA
jgi:hypothetical protein